MPNSRAAFLNPFLLTNSLKTFSNIMVIYILPPLNCFVKKKIFGNEAIYEIDKRIFKEGSQSFYAESLHFMYYNFCRIYQALRMTPAMKAKVTDRLWEIEDILALLK